MSETKRWNYHSRAQDAEPLRMAEPRPRIGPIGTTTHVSVRPSDAPQASVRRVKEICLHYVKKCSGKYTDNITAARYVHQMADEVIGQLAGIIAQIQRYEAEPELYQSLLADWEQHFPPSLGAIGTPKAVAAALAKQAEDIRRLTNELDAEKTKHEADVSNVVKAMEAQLVAYRSGIVNERKQITASHANSVEQYEQDLATLRHQHAEEKDALTASHHHEMQKQRKMHDRHLRQLENQLKSLENAFLAREQDKQFEFEGLIAGKNEVMRGLEDKIRKLQEEAVQQSGIIAMPGADAQSVVSLELDLFESDEEEEDEEEEEEEETTSSSEESTTEESESEDEEEDEEVAEEAFVSQNRASVGRGGRPVGDRPAKAKKPKLPKPPKPPKEKKVKAKKPKVQKPKSEKKTLPSRQPASSKKEAKAPKLIPKASNGKDAGEAKKQKPKQHKKLHIAGVVGEAIRKLKEVITTVMSPSSFLDSFLVIFMTGNCLFEEF
jgi:hypothetical protein